MCYVLRSVESFGWVYLTVIGVVLGKALKCYGTVGVVGNSNSIENSMNVRPSYVA
jgi:hypothetical protein